MSQWRGWLRGRPDPVATLSATGELLSGPDGISWVITSPSPWALSEVFLTPSAVVHPREEHCVPLGVFLGIAPKHRRGYMQDRENAKPCPGSHARRGVSRHRKAG